MAKYKIPYLISENMFPYCLLIFIFSTHAHFLHSYEANNKIINNKKDLINIINSLNHLDETSKNNNEDERKIFTNGNTEELTDTEKEKKLQQLLWLMKTNYDAQKQYDLLQNPAHSGARLYFIRNPETIDEYKKYLEQKTKASRKQNVKAKLQQLRRHVMLRNNAEENDDSENDKKDQSKLFTEDKNSLAGDDGQSRHRDSVEDKIQYNNDHFEAVSIALCRKYDIEQESRALYGESLKSIVERFRRTPEYLTILKDEVSELLKKLEAVSDRIVYVYSLKLYDRVLQEMGVNQTLLRTRPKDIYPRFGKAPHRPRISRQGANNSRTNMLDSYEQLRNPLTLPERNRMKELGFEYCGLAIHAMLENMSPDDALPISTLLPNGGNQDKFPTQHHQHEITQPWPSTEPETHPQQHSTNTGRHH